MPQNTYFHTWKKNRKYLISSSNICFTEYLKYRELGSSKKNKVVFATIDLNLKK